MIKKFRVCPHGKLYCDCPLCSENLEEERLIQLLRLYGNRDDV